MLLRCVGELSAGHPVARCVQAPSCQAPLLGTGNAKDSMGIFSLPKNLGAVSFQKLSSQELGPEPLQEPAYEAPCRLSWLLEQHEAMGTCVSHGESQLHQHGEH